MLTKELKSTVDTLSERQRHELACYLTKLALQNNSDYWQAIRRRTGSDHKSTWLEAEKASQR